MIKNLLKKISIEGTLEKILNKVTWLNLGSEQLKAEFASHIAWSALIPYFVTFHFWPGHLKLCMGIMIAYAVYKETVSDGHITRMVKGIETPEQKKDFFTDLLSRTIFPILVLIFA